MKRSGLSLAEVLVVCGLMVMLGLMLVTIYSQGLNAQVHADAATSAYRNCFVTLEQVKRQLRGARLNGPPLGASAALLNFVVPQMSQGLVSVDSRANVIWSAPQSLDRNAQGDVIWHSEAGDRVLGHLGADGSLTFKRVFDKMIEIQLQAYSTDSRGTSSYALSYDLFLPNQ